MHTSTSPCGTIHDAAPDHEFIDDCPFCGGIATLTHTWTAHYWVECGDCGAEVSDPSTDCSDDHDKREHIYSARRAIKSSVTSPASDVSRETPLPTDDRVAAPLATPLHDPNLP